MTQFNNILKTLYKCFVCSFSDYIYYSNEASMQDIGMNMDLNSQIMIMDNANSAIIAQESALNLLSIIYEMHNIVKQTEPQFDFRTIAFSNEDISDIIVRHMTVRAGWPEEVIEEELEDFINESQLDFLQQTMQGQIVEFPYIMPDFFNNEDFF